MRITIEEASHLLNQGQVVALPTETVYGLAASLKHPEAISDIYKLKGRPSNNPLIVHVSSISQIYEFTSSLPPHFEELGQAFWPGPLTLVIPIKSETIPQNARANLTTSGFRIPAQKQTCQIIDNVGPLVMPSANLSGKPSGTNPNHIETDFGLSLPVVDGGSSECGVESTILCYHQNRWEIIRLGAIPAEAFTKILGYQPVFKEKTSEKPLCPGQMYRHYAPQAKMHLSDQIPTNYSGPILGFKERNYLTSKIELGSLASPESVAENLYAILRKLDDDKIQEVLVDMDFPQTGLWLTIAERLRKAALS